MEELSLEVAIVRRESPAPALSLAPMKDEKKEEEMNRREMGDEVCYFRVGMNGFWEGSYKLLWLYS